MRLNPPGLRLPPLEAPAMRCEGRQASACILTLPLGSNVVGVCCVTRRKWQPPFFNLILEELQTGNGSSTFGIRFRVSALTSCQSVTSATLAERVWQRWQRPNGGSGPIAQAIRSTEERSRHEMTSRQCRSVDEAEYLPKAKCCEGIMRHPGAIYSLVCTCYVFLCTIVWGPGLLKGSRVSLHLLGLLRYCTRSHYSDCPRAAPK